VETPLARGQLVAALLKGAWRAEAGACEVAPQNLTAISALCVASGAAPLAWWNIRRSAFASTGACESLHQAFLHSSVQAVRYRHALADLLTALRERDIDPIVVKGWAIARHYPTLGLRPYSDHDLCVRPADADRARAILSSHLGGGALADVHSGFATLDDTQDETLRARAIQVECEGTRVAVLADEDHLRVICRHLLRHGAARPLWLCDVAMAVESRSSSFDWGRCLGSSRRVRLWTIRALQIAHAILGMSVEGTPAAESRSPLPRWVVPAVLDTWSSITFGLPKLGHSLDSPGGVVRELVRHWPNPLQATIAVRGPINRLPRLPFQLAACVPGAMRATSDVLTRYTRRGPLRARVTS